MLLTYSFAAAELEKDLSQMEDYLVCEMNSIGEYYKRAFVT